MINSGVPKKMKKKSNNFGFKPKKRKKEKSFQELLAEELAKPSEDEEEERKQAKPHQRNKRVRVVRLSKKETKGLREQEEIRENFINDLKEIERETKSLEKNQEKLKDLDTFNRAMKSGNVTMSGGIGGTVQKVKEYNAIRLQRKKDELALSKGKLKELQAELKKLDREEIMINRKEEKDKIRELLYQSAKLGQTLDRGKKIKNEKKNRKKKKRKNTKGL